MMALFIVPAVFGAVCLLLGYIFLRVSNHLSQKLDRKVMGKIVDLTPNAALYNRGLQDELGSMHTSVGYRSCDMFHKVYAYNVNGQTYTRAGSVSYSLSLVENQVGKDVAVYYDSADPSRSALSDGRGFRIASRILLPIGVALLVLAAWVWKKVL